MCVCVSSLEQQSVCRALWSLSARLQQQAAGLKIVCLFSEWVSGVYGLLLTLAPLLCKAGPTWQLEQSTAKRRGVAWHINALPCKVVL